MIYYNRKEAVTDFPMANPYRFRDRGFKESVTFYENKDMSIMQES
jgi:hypothetical protein